jgi:hypothetical protein|tara:strand:- start:89 stop:202 length:114 start_codon:yes stop_codon:yes gene_type:complete
MVCGFIALFKMFINSWVKIDLTPSESKKELDNSAIDK